jgi:hypothetical protein
LLPPPQQPSCRHHCGAATLLPLPSRRRNCHLAAAITATKLSPSLRRRHAAAAAIVLPPLPAATANCYESRVLWYLHTVLTYQSHVTS